MTVREAYLKWQKELSGWSSNCCQKSHHFIDERGCITWKSDQDVCRREQAWREYVRLRDENPNFPFATRGGWH